MVGLYDVFKEIFKTIPASELIDDVNRFTAILLDYQVEKKKINLIKTSISMCKKNLHDLLQKPSKDSYEDTVKIISNETDYASDAVDEFVRSLLATGIPNLLFSSDLSTLIKCYEEFEGNCIIPDYVTSIERFAFSYLKKIISIQFSSSIDIIKSKSIVYCNNLKEIIIPEGIKEIKCGAICGCAIKELRLPNSLISIEPGSFRECDDLVRVYIGLSPCDEFFSVFASLESISVSPDNKYVCSVDGNLYSKDMKTLIRHPPKAAFCSIPQSVTHLGVCSFEQYMGHELIIPDNIVSIGDVAFNYSPNIQEITIPKSVKEIGGGLFDGCSNLESITINCDCKDVRKIIIGEFGDLKTLSSLVNVEVSPDNKSLSSFDGIITNKDGTKLYFVPPGLISFTTPYSISEVESHSFSSDKLSSVIITSNVKSIKESAFENCPNLSEVLINDGLVSLSPSSFDYCPNLKNVLIPDSVTDFHEDDHSIFCMEQGYINVGRYNPFIFIFNSNLIEYLTKKGKLETYLVITDIKDKIDFVNKLILQMDVKSRLMLSIPPLTKNRKVYLDFINGDSDYVLL